MPFRILVVLGASVAAAIAGAIYPFWGLLALEFLTFGRPQDDRPNVEVLHIPMIMVIAVVLSLLPRLGKYGPGLVAGARRIWVMLLLYCLLLASALANGWTIFSRERLYDFGTVVFLCIATLAVVNSVPRLQYYLLMLLGCGAYVAQRVLRNPGNIFEQIGHEQFERAALARGAGNFGNSNFLALLMVLTILVGLSLIGAYRKWWQRALLLSLIGMCGVVFFRANSRGASIGLAVSLICMWCLSKSKLKSSVFAAVLALVAAFAAPPAYWARLNTVLHYQEDASATNRLKLWDQAWNLTASNPILGVGPDNFVLYSDSTQHDSYLQVASEAGVPALLVYIAWLLAGLWAALSARRLASPEEGGNPYLYSVSVGIFCCIIAIIVQGFTTGFAFREFVYGYVAFAFLAQRLAKSFIKSTSDETLENRVRPAVFERVHVPVG